MSLYGTTRPKMAGIRDRATIIDFEADDYLMQRDLSKCKVEKRKYESPVNGYRTVANIATGDKLRYVETFSISNLSGAQMAAITPNILEGENVTYFPHKANTTWSFEANIVSVEYWHFIDPIKFDSVKITVESRSYTEPLVYVP